MDPPPTVSAPEPANPNGNDSIWPRRTSKACSNCRREKLRCSGERPCSGCARKSLQCLDGCDPCRRARARCERSGDGNGGCNRCEERDLECTADQQQPIVHPPAPVPVGPTSPERVRTACQNCRNDNKKCDNQRPCSRCVSRSETCIPLPRGPKQAKTRCEGCRKRNVLCEDARPCQNCVTAGTECVNLARQGRGCGTRVKAACVSCRRNKIRCDGGRPCTSCNQRGKGPDCREQACKRCGQDECSHRPRPKGNSDGDSPTGNESTPSTSRAGQPPSPSAIPQNYPGPISWANLANPSIFGPPAQQGLAYMPPPNPVPNTTTTTDSAPP